MAEIMTLHHAYQLTKVDDMNGHKLIHPIWKGKRVENYKTGLGRRFWNRTKTRREKERERGERERGQVGRSRQKIKEREVPFPPTAHSECQNTHKSHISLSQEFHLTPLSAKFKPISNSANALDSLSLPLYLILWRKKTMESAEASYMSSPEAPRRRLSPPPPKSPGSGISLTLSFSDLIHFLSLLSVYCIMWCVYLVAISVVFVF